MTWRARATPIIAGVLSDTAGKPESEIRKALRDAYPFHMRKYHPYKIWLDEIKRQRGTKPPLGTRTKPRPGLPDKDDTSQRDLFDG